LNAHLPRPAAAAAAAAAASRHNDATLTTPMNNSARPAQDLAWLLLLAHYLHFSASTAL